MYFEEPESVILNFIRSRISELVRRNKNNDGDLSNRQTAASKSFTPTVGQTELTLVDSPLSIVSVSVDSVTKIPYEHYNIDLDNKKVKFRTAFEGTETALVSYYKGTNWIFPDKPRKDLARDSYPRISCIQLTENPIFIELGTTETNEYVTFQFDVLSFKDQLCKIGSETIEGPDIAIYLARKIVNAFKDYWSTDLLYVIRDIKFMTNDPIPFDEGLNLFRRTVDIQFTFRNMRNLVS